MRSTRSHTTVSRYRKRIHDEPGIDARSDNGHLCLAGCLVQPSDKATILRNRIGCLFGRRDDWHAALQDFFELREHARQLGAGAEHRDVGFSGCQRLAYAVGNSHSQPAAQLEDLAGVPADLRRIDVHRADQLKPFAHVELTRDGGADGSKTDEHHSNCHVGSGREKRL